jgi:hypothetical protein
VWDMALRGSMGLAGRVCMEEFTDIEELKGWMRRVCIELPSII